MRSRCLLISVILAIGLSLFSCQQPENVIPKEEYSSPTIKGTVSIPEGRDISPGDIYVKVVDEGGNTDKVDRVRPDKTFVVEGLKEGTKYSILFTSEEPENANIRGLARGPEKSNGVGGWLHDVVPEMVTGKDVGSVKLKPLGTIRGKAEIDGSSEHYDTTVYIPGTSFIAITNEDGTFAIFNVPEGNYTLRYTHEGYMPVMKDGVILVCPEDAENPEISVGDERLISNTGTVEGMARLGDAEDSSVVSIRLESEDNSLVYTSTSSREGNYVINNVKPGTYRVIASSAGYISQSSQYFTVSPATLTQVTEEIMLFGNNGTVTGSVSLFDSEAKSGIAVLISDVNSSNSFSTASDGNGNFQKIVKPGEYTVSASYPGYVSVSYRITVIENNATDVSFSPLLPDSGTITGESFSPEEQVTVLATDGTPIQTIQSGLDKSYRFERVPTGTYSVKFSKTGYASYIVSEVVVAPSSTTVINGVSLKSSYGTISGTAGSEGETVYLVRDGVQIKATTTLESKEYIFSEIEPGEYSVCFTKSGYKLYESEAITVKAGESYVVDGNKLVSIYGAVAGFVFLPGSDDYSGVAVTLTNSESITSSLVAITASDGSFRITDIKEGGTYLLTYSKDGYVTENTKSVDVTIGSVANAGSVTLKSTYATVKGTVQLEGASTHENITILLRNDNNQYTASTDQKGEYLINRVTPGTYTLLASKDGFVTGQIPEIVIEPSSEKTIEAKTLSVAIRSVTGSVTLELLSDYSGALVTATNLADDTLVYSAITNSEGKFTLAGMTPGEYCVVISCNGYRTETLPTINIVSSSTTNLTVTNMLVNRGTVSGTATLEGRSSSSGIKVELLRGSEVYAESTTDESGNYSFYVPQGNYSGVRYSKTDFASVSVSRNIALFADNYVSTGDTILKATHNTISGTVDVLTTDNEGDVTISFDGEESMPSLSTASDGAFSFDHIPVGSYVMRFRRTDCSDITVPVEVKAADVIDLGTVTITPNTATIKGTVVLKEGLSSEGVTVSIDVGGKTLQTTTDSSGRYEIGGVSTADEYTVTYSKNGWDTNTQIISPKLGLLETREMNEMTLVDTTSPVLKSVTINNGANTAADRNVNIRIDAEDNGSGISNMLVYDYYNPQYLGTFSSLKNWTFESSNGLKTVYVKLIDRAGNESNIVSAQVTLTDQKKEVKGVLKGEDLTWTKEMSPYLVTGNLLVEKDDTLNIQPGVDVQFSGDYYLQVEGKLEAIGTESDRIKIYGIDDGANNWDGIKFLADEPNRLSYIDISGLKNGITGYCDIDNAMITANGWAVGKEMENSIYYRDDRLKGSLTNSTVKGSVSVAYYDVKGNTIDGNPVYLFKTPFVGDNTISGSTSIWYSNIDGNTFSGSKLDTRYSFVYNNEVSSTTVYSYNDIQKYVTYNGSTIYLGYSSSSSRISSGLYNIQFNNCSFPRFAADVRESNFINCGPITVESNRSTQEKYICTGNYWGDINTVEIKSKGEGKNLSFITDYYDDFNKTRIEYSKYRESANMDAGYREKEPDGSYSGYSIGDKGPAGGYVFYDKGYYSDGWRYLEAAPSDIGRYVFGCYRPDVTNERVVGTAEAIGAGRYNTERLVEYMDIDGKAYSDSSGAATAEYAAKKCIDYSYGGYDDWFLPSRDELCEMYKALKCPAGTNHGKDCPDKTHAATSTEETRSSFANNVSYWSSSEYDSNSAWYQYFGSGYQYDYSCGGYSDVRAVRAF